jgi:hypothetical protein
VQFTMHSKKSVTTKDTKVHEGLSRIARLRGIPRRWQRKTRASRFAMLRQDACKQRILRLLNLEATATKASCAFAIEKIERRSRLHLRVPRQPSRRALAGRNSCGQRRAV